jgi:hypothetical protein
MELAVLRVLAAFGISLTLSSPTLFVKFFLRQNLTFLNPQPISPLFPIN